MAHFCVYVCKVAKESEGRMFDFFVEIFGLGPCWYERIVWERASGKCHLMWYLVFLVVLVLVFVFVLVTLEGGQPWYGWVVWERPPSKCRISRSYGTRSSSAYLVSSTQALTSTGGRPPGKCQSEEQDKQKIHSDKQRQSLSSTGANVGQSFC